MPDDWIAGADLDEYPLTTGPNKPQPPPMGRGDRVLFHAVIHGRVFAEAEIVGNPRRQPHPVWGDRWPWLFPCRVDIWVPLISYGQRTSEVAPKRAIGRIQAGGEFAKLSQAEHAAILEALLLCPEVERRQPAAS
jgi:hypothetical protein